MTSGLLETPLCQWHGSRGARMVDFSGWSMPVQYTSIVQEHRATRTAAGLFDISHMGRFRFTGPDAVTALDRILTRRVSDVAVGTVRYSLITNESGGILDDVLFYRIPSADGDQACLLVVNAGNRDKIADWIKRHTETGSSLQFRDETLETAMIAVQGPSAALATSAVVQARLDELDYYHCIATTILGEPGLVSRTGYTGEDGYELMLPGQVATEVWEQLLSTVEHVGAMPVGLGARDTLRLEAAMPLYGHELSESIDPYQAGLGFAVQLKDRQFLGRDALAEHRERPTPVRRVGIALSGRRVAREGHPVLCGGERVGEVTSGTFSPTLERSIAMAYVRSQDASVGNAVDVEIRGKCESAEVVPLPFYRRKPR